MARFYWIKRLFKRDALSRLMKWADKSGAVVELSSNVNPESFSYEVIVSARNVRLNNPFIGETFLSVRGADTDAAARAFLRRIETEEHFITNTEAAK